MKNCNLMKTISKKRRKNGQEYTKYLREKQMWDLNRKIPSTLIKERETHRNLQQTNKKKKHNK